MGIFSSTPEEEEKEEIKKVVKPPRPTPKQFKGKLTSPIVLLYSYIGTGYHGLQYQDGVSTIEKELLQAISDAGLIPPKSYLDLARIKWYEASRTDVGVHAAAQVVSFKIALPSGMKVKDTVPLISRYLPYESPIKVWKAISFSDTFNAQKFADGRRYKYLMPLHAFKEQTKEHLQYLRDNVLPLFVGEKNYHNYTKRVSPGLKKCRRTIWDFEVSDPFKVEGEKYVLWIIHGNSFMMNQIRKMLATVLSVSHEVLSLDDLENTFTLQCWNLARLPGDGLFLDKVEYIAQKKKYGKYGPSWDVEFDDQRLSIEKWEKNVLYPHIAHVVKEKNVFRDWIKNALLKFPPSIRQEEQKQ